MVSPTCPDFLHYPGADWRSLLSQSIGTAEQLCRSIGVPAEAAQRVVEKYPMRINPYLLSIIGKPGGPIYRQMVPDPAELEEGGISAEDPLFEAEQSPAPCIIHRYPDRVLFLASGQCAVYCRHCMRKRSVGVGPAASEREIEAGIKYIRSNPAVREVILSGGDPLLIDDERIGGILEQLKGIGHVRLLRIHTRVPCALPQRITGDLVEILRRYQPLYVNIQFNHPDELTPEAVFSCSMLADAGIVLGSQTVLLKGVNDRPEVVIELMRRLLESRVRPYYLHHPDPVRGTAHFRVPVEQGIKIMKQIRGRIGGAGVPQYVIDLPGGGGKVPVGPEYVIRREKGRLLVRNFEGKIYGYPG